MRLARAKDADNLVIVGADNAIMAGKQKIAKSGEKSGERS